jgi:hypothetical protein
MGSVDSPSVLVACSFASVGFFGNNESSSLKQCKTNHIISGTISTITGIHSKIVRLTVTNGGPFMVDLWPTHGMYHM